LLRVPSRGLASLAGQLDDRICRLHIEDANDDRRRYEPEDGHRQPDDR
jgi:hypothetical protein